jgi:signal transduction histidine kinase
MTRDRRERSLVNVTESGSGTEGVGRAAVERTRASRAAMQRRVLPFWVTAIVVVAYLTASKPPYAGLHGRSLALSLALGGFVVGLTGTRHVVLVRRASTRVYLPFLLVLVLSSSMLVWLQPRGIGVIGFLGAGVLVLMGRVIQGRVRVLVAAACCLAALTAAALTGKQPDRFRWESLLVSVLPFLVYLLLTSVFIWHRQQQEQTERLLLELDQTRGAELRAVTLAERQRLARDMHDVLAHTLSGLTVQLEGIRLLALSEGDQKVASAVDRAHQLAKNGLAEARQAISMLRGDELPGPERLAGLADEFAADTGIPCRFTESGDVVGLRAEVKLALYRVTQEALTNVRKHAHPDRVEVRLEYQGNAVAGGPGQSNAVAGGPGQSNAVLLWVRDFGAGPPEPSGSGAPPGSGYGLAGMRERAELLGGTLTAEPTEDGFLVELRVLA